MVYAKDMAELSEKALAERREYEQNKMNEDTSFTNQFCHSTLSRMVETAAASGKRCLIIYVMREDAYGYPRYELMEKKNTYWGHTWQYLNLTTLRNIVEEHKYTISEETTSLPKSSTKTWVCRKITIEW